MQAPDDSSVRPVGPPRLDLPCIFKSRAASVSYEMVTAAPADSPDKPQPEISAPVGPTIHKPPRASPSHSQDPIHPKDVGSALQTEPPLKFDPTWIPDCFRILIPGSPPPPRVKRKLSTAFKDDDGNLVGDGEDNETDEEEWVYSEDDEWEKDDLARYAEMVRGAATRRARRRRHFQ